MNLQTNCKNRFHYFQPFSRRIVYLFISCNQKLMRKGQQKDINYREFLKQPLAKRLPTRRFLEIVLIYSPLATNETQDCVARFDAVAQSWLIFQGCISNVRYYTTVHIQVWESDSGLTLWIKEGTSKETLDKKYRRAVRSGRTSKFIKTIKVWRTLQDLPTYTLTYSVVLKSICQFP